MRNGYPAPWTYGDQLRWGQFGRSGPRFDHWRRICEIVVDGQRLHDVRPLRRTPSAHETRLSQKFGEVMIAAHALARLDVASIAIDTGGDHPYERPDLRVRLDGRAIALEVGEVHPYAAGTNAAIDLHIALNKLADSNPDLRPEHTFLHIGRSAGRAGHNGAHRKVRKQLLSIVEEMLLSKGYRRWLSDSLQCVQSWKGADLGFTLYVAPFDDAAGYIQFDDSACSFNPEGLIGPALRMLKRKRDMAESYDRSLPLWLVLGLTEQQGVYTKSLEALAQRAAAIAPFERVIAHDGGLFVVYAGQPEAA